MAERRMFTKKITDDDNFVMLSSSAQALYLHLSMQADDDGFCNQINASMFKAHASVEDLKSLLERRYIYQFDDGVIVIKHWRMANALRKDRYTPTSFQEDFAKLDIKDNGSYTLKDDEKIGCRSVATCLPQERKGKEREEEKKENTLLIKDERERKPTPAEIENEFEMLWKLYPKKQGPKKSALKSYQKARNKGVTFEQVKAGIEQYALHYYHEHKDRDLQYMAYGSTWFNQERWNDEYNTEVKPTVQDIKSAVNLSSWGVK